MLSTSWRRTRERRGQTRDGHHRHLTIERYPTNIKSPREQDGQAVAYRAINKMQVDELIHLLCKVRVSGDECDAREQTNAHRRDNDKEFQDE